MPERPHLAYPVALSPGGRLFTTEQDSDREVADCIAVIVGWPLGTRRGESDFGMPSQLFASGGPDLAEMRSFIAANEPRATGLRDELVDHAISRGIATVDVGFDQGATVE